MLTRLIFTEEQWLSLWGQVTHICVTRLNIIGLDNGFSPAGHQAIIRTNTGIWLMGHLGTNFIEIRIVICRVSFKKIHLKMSEKWRPFCLGPIVLKRTIILLSTSIIYLLSLSTNKLPGEHFMNSHFSHVYLSYIYHLMRHYADMWYLMWLNVFCSWALKFYRQVSNISRALVGN